jgi:hypothetical protein
MNSIEEIWEKGNQEISLDKSLDEAFIRDSISKTSISITSKLPKSIWFGVAASLVSSLELIYNISFYSNNSSILATICLLLVLSILMTVFMLVQLRVIKNMDNKEYNLHKLLQYKIKYFNTRLKITRYTVALSIVFVTFGINLTMENSDGIFELNKILMLSIFYVFAYLIMVYLQKFTHDIYLKQLRNALYNLKENTLISLDNELKKHRRIVKLIGIIIGIIFIAGIFLLLLNTKI